jgi:phage shock protein E
MFDKIAKFLKGTDYKELVSNGAVILDVRMPAEYKGGHIKGSKNVPLNTISKNAMEIKNWDKSVILCCKSGMRSSQAAEILKAQGVDAVNGGGWTSLSSRLR